MGPRVWQPKGIHNQIFKSINCINYIRMELFKFYHSTSKVVFFFNFLFCFVLLCFVGILLSFWLQPTCSKQFRVMQSVIWWSSLQNCEVAAESEVPTTQYMQMSLQALKEHEKAWKNCDRFTIHKYRTRMFVLPFRRDSENFHLHCYFKE